MPVLRNKSSAIWGNCLASFFFFFFMFWHTMLMKLDYNYHCFDLLIYGLTLCVALQGLFLSLSLSIYIYVCVCVRCFIIAHFQD